MFASAAQAARNKRQRLFSPCLAALQALAAASIACAALQRALAFLAAILRCAVATIAARMAALHRRRALFGPMCAKTALSQFREMRRPIARKKVYGRARKAPVDTPAAARDVTVGAEALQTVTTARLDKHETIELAKATLQQICIAPDAPSNAKATAARTLLELVGALGRHADPGAMNTLPASEMSLEQLEARIAALITH
jgi:hypothetical protein